MPRLLLLRHAKSAYPSRVADHERPLNDRGREAAPRMGRYLADEGLVPDLAIVSDARRTRETWDLVAPSFGRDVRVRFEPRVYEASAERLLAVVREVEDEVGTLLLVGHNPGFEDLATLLVGTGDRDALARLTVKFPTAALAVIDVEDGSWSVVAPRGGRLERFVTPKSLGADEDD